VKLYTVYYQLATASTVEPTTNVS